MPNISILYICNMERDIFNVCHISINPNKRDIKHHYENLLKNKKE